MDDSPVRDGSVPLDKTLFFQLVENGYHCRRAQVSVVRKGFGRHLTQIPNPLQNNDLRDREPGQSGHFSGAQVNGPDDLPDSLDHLRCLHRLHYYTSINLNSND